jgi:hypothetical protein
MRLNQGSLGPDVLDGALATLLSIPVEDSPEGALPLFRYTEKAELVEEMPLFDQSGLVPKGHVGPRDNPLVVEVDSGGSGGSEDSEEATEEDASRAPPRTRRQLLCELKDDDAESDPPAAEGALDRGAVEPPAPEAHRGAETFQGPEAGDAMSGSTATHPRGPSGGDRAMPNSGSDDPPPAGEKKRKWYVSDE